MFIRQKQTGSSPVLVSARRLAAANSAAQLPLLADTVPFLAETLMLISSTSVYPTVIHHSLR